MSRTIVKYDKEFVEGSGSASRVLWNNSQVLKAFELLFQTAEDEKIAGLIMDESGITAYFKRK
jgi:hypothetical protein